MVYYGLYGIKKDRVLSLVWYSLADVENMRDELTPEQLAYADSLIENWRLGLGFCAKE